MKINSDCIVSGTSQVAEEQPICPRIAPSGNSDVVTET